MPTINLEMMKQLLQEFSEKEALTTEEVNVIEKEISDLEKRIELCHLKLKHLSEDKEKLASIKERYVDGNIVSPSRTGIKEIAEKTEIKINQQKPVNIAPDKQDSEEQIDTPVEKQTAEVEPANEIESEVSVSSDNVSPESKDASKTVSKESGDMGKSKSINDALKGLFRK